MDHSNHTCPDSQQKPPQTSTHSQPAGFSRPTRYATPYRNRNSSLPPTASQAVSQGKAFSGSKPPAPHISVLQPAIDGVPLGKNTKFCSTPSQPTSENLYPLEQGAGSLPTYEERHEWLSLLREISTNERVKECGKYVDLEAGNTADVHLNGHGRARWANIRRCGLRWPCPVCAPFKAAKERRRLMVALCKAMLARTDPKFDVDDLDESHDIRGKYAILFVTCTVPHGYSDRLKTTSDLVVKAWNYATGAGRRKGMGGARETWDESFGVAGFARCLDLTVGKNGWHPHIHAAVIVDADRVRDIGSDTFLSWFKAWFYRRWDYRVRKLTGKTECACTECDWKGDFQPKLPTSKHVVGVEGRWNGQGTRPNYDPTQKDSNCPKCEAPLKRVDCVSLEHGVDITWARSPSDVANYVRKEALGPSMELTEGHRKLGISYHGGRSPMQLLKDLSSAHTSLSFGEGDELDEQLYREDLRRWREYETDMQGRSALRCSKGFWRHKDFGVEGMSGDDQIEFLADSVNPDERLDQEDPEVVLSVVPWLYTYFVRFRLDGWALRICEAGGKALEQLKEYCRTQQHHPVPPPYFKGHVDINGQKLSRAGKILAMVVTMVEAERRREKT